MAPWQATPHRWRFGAAQDCSTRVGGLPRFVRVRACRGLVVGVFLSVGSAALLFPALASTTPAVRHGAVAGDDRRGLSDLGLTASRSASSRCETPPPDVLVRNLLGLRRFTSWASPVSSSSRWRPVPERVSSARDAVSPVIANLQGTLSAT